MSEGGRERAVQRWIRGGGLIYELGILARTFPTFAQQERHTRCFIVSWSPWWILDDLDKECVDEYKRAARISILVTPSMMSTQGSHQ
jgi:hypothetical protein